MYLMIYIYRPQEIVICHYVTKILLLAICIHIASYSVNIYIGRHIFCESKILSKIRGLIQFQLSLIAPLAVN